MNGERDLTDSFRAVCDADASRKPSPGLEAALLGEFRRRKTRRTFWKRAGAAGVGAIAAALVIAAVLAARHVPRQAARQPAVISTWHPAPAHPNQIQLAKALPPAHRRRPTRRSVAAPEIMAGFVPLPYGGEITAFEHPMVVRIRLPLASLEIAGFPPSDSAELVDADVLLGEDGLARAIRFVR